MQKVQFEYFRGMEAEQYSFYCVPKILGRCWSNTGKGVFTIVEVKSGTGSAKGWGRLKSGAGWIALDYASRV